MFKARLPIRPALTRGYASRLPERPRSKVKDPLKDNPHAAYQNLPGELTFIHRPPPSAASPESFTTAPSSPLLGPASSSGGASLPPALAIKKPEPPRMSAEDIAKMRELRVEDPARWTTGELAKRFNCTNMFVRMMAPLEKTQRRIALAKRDALHEHYRARWGEKARLVKEIRDKRKEFW